MNLCVNARDAISGDGTITVRTENRTVGLGEASDPESDSKEGDYVVLAVSDTGCGMTPAQKAKIFEPFFTTKEQGKGTGLGLSMCYGIIKQHEGWIECVSNEDVGTSFRVFLPRAKRTAAKKERDLSVSAADAAIVPQEHTILLADDEPAVRMVHQS
jgi:two-component system cell cycle sensor histidine kinase/response regulator CckA